MIRKGLLLQEEIDKTNAEITLRQAFNRSDGKSQLKEADEINKKMNETNLGAAANIFANKLANAEAERKLQEARIAEQKLIAVKVHSNYKYNNRFIEDQSNFAYILLLDCRIKNFLKSSKMDQLKNASKHFFQMDNFLRLKLKLHECCKALGELDFDVKMRGSKQRRNYCYDKKPQR